MQKVGENATPDSDYSDEDISESEEMNKSNSTSRPNNMQNLNGFNYQGNYQNDPYGNPNTYNQFGVNGQNRFGANGQNQFGSNGQNQFGGNDQNRFAANGQNRYGANGQGRFGNEGPNNYGANNYPDSFNQKQYPNQNVGYGNSSQRANNQTEQDRACLVHCFFHQLKMVGTCDRIGFCSITYV